MTSETTGTTGRELKISLEITDREGQILADAILFIWKSGAVQSKDGALELIDLEDRIEKAIVAVKGREHGPSSI